MEKKMAEKKYFPLIIILFLLICAPIYRANAQTTTASGLVSTTFDTSDFPQWAKDVRRWEIVAFGSFPFAMFTTTFFMDTQRWIDNSGMSWSEEGRRYAPWPFKSAGAVDMTNKQHEMTLAIAAGLSAAVAFADLIIVQIKRHAERRRIENLPPGTAIIIKRPLEDRTGDGEGAVNGRDSPASGASAPLESPAP
jgi:hypothetical protein